MIENHTINWNDHQSCKKTRNFYYPDYVAVAHWIVWNFKREKERLSANALFSTTWSFVVFVLNCHILLNRLLFHVSFHLPTVKATRANCTFCSNLASFDCIASRRKNQLIFCEERTFREIYQLCSVVAFYLFFKYCYLLGSSTTLQYKHSSGQVNFRLTRSSSSSFTCLQSG